MKLTTRQLRKIIKEEIKLMNEVEDPNSPLSARDDILDAISMLEEERDPHGTLLNVINRLETALGKL